MAIPLTGALSASMINVEFGRSATATFSLEDAETGGYGAINTCSINRPNGSAPYAMSEWYGYDHNAVCLNSYYAMGDGGDSASQNMLYSNTKPYGSNVSTTRPDPTATLTISFWIKQEANSTQGYLMGLDDAVSGDRMVVYWGSYEDPNDPGVYISTINFTYNQGGGAFVGSQCNIGDDNNSPISGVSAADQWGNSGNVGSVDTNGYALITIVVDYNSWDTDDYITWYWNDQRMIVPWLNGAYNQSYTYGDSITTPTWTDAVLTIGGLIPTELSSGVQLDGFAIYVSTALSSGNVTTIYNSGAVASVASYRGISTNLLFYNFEDDTPNIGNDTGNTYDMFLDELGNPQRIADPAA
jgi:hypothetical protein